MEASFSDTPGTANPNMPSTLHPQRPLPNKNALNPKPYYTGLQPTQPLPKKKKNDLKLPLQNSIQPSKIPYP